MVRARTLLATLAIAAAAILAGARAQAEPVRLTWFMWSGSEPEVVAWKHVAELVTKQHPDITVEFQTTSFPDYWTKLPTLAASGRLPDIVSLQSLRAPGFADLMEPLDARVAADKFDLGAFDPSIVEGLSRDGQHFALPYDFGPLVLYYNRDMLAKAGIKPPAPGWTGDDFLAAAKALTKDGAYGFAVSQPDAFIAYALSRGARYLDDAGEADLTNPGLTAAFTDYARLVSEAKVAPLLPASGTQSSSLANGRFTSGNVAMYVDGPWQLINIKKKAGFTVGVAPIPAREAGGTTISAGSGFGIATTSKHKDAAWKAIQVMTGPEAEQYLAEQGRAFPARSAFQRYWYDTAAEGVVGARDAIAASLPNARPYKTTPNWSTISALFEQYGPVAYAGTEPPAQVLQTIQTLGSQ